jgi:hypothetical protein
MTDKIARFLLDNYYSKYPEVSPTFEQIVQGFNAHSDKFVFIYDNPQDQNIIGCAIFLTLEDDTYLNIEQINIKDLNVLQHLIQEQGPNIHFVLLAANSRDIIRAGIRLIKEKKHPKTISWWNPDFTHLHKYNLN